MWLGRSYKNIQEGLGGGSVDTVVARCKQGDHSVTPSAQVRAEQGGMWLTPALRGGDTASFLELAKLQVQWGALSHK